MTLIVVVLSFFQNETQKNGRMINKKYVPIAPMFFIFSDSLVVEIRNKIVPIAKTKTTAISVIASIDLIELDRIVQIINEIISTKTT